MEIKTQLADDSSTLHVFLIGDLNETQSIAFADRLINSVVGRLAPVVSINCSQCSGICTSGIGALVSFALAPEIEGCIVEVTGQSSELEARMRGLKLDRIFRFAPVNERLESHESSRDKDAQI